MMACLQYQIRNSWSEPYIWAPRGRWWWNAQIITKNGPWENGPGKWPQILLKCTYVHDFAVCASWVHKLAKTTLIYPKYWCYDKNLPGWVGALDNTKEAQNIFRKNLDAIYSKIMPNQRVVMIHEGGEGLSREAGFRAKISRKAGF